MIEEQFTFMHQPKLNRKHIIEKKKSLRLVYQGKA